MFRACRVVMALVCTLLGHWLKSSKVAKLSLPERWHVAMPVVQKMIKVFMAPTKARVVYHGLENIPEDRAVFFVSNHQSYFDIPIIIEVMDRATGFIAKDSLGKAPLLSTWMRHIGCLFMDREDIKQSVQVIRQAGEQLKMGLNMVIFPEGTRSKGGDPHEFKKGSLKPAFIAGAPVVPICIQGAYKIFEANPGFCVKPAEVHVYVGEAVETANMSKAEQREFAAGVEEWIFRQKEIIK
ncbi:MAG: 1-acyl-sn-glycerol-3-phosphate acyltransferase [Firmicutes bacterium]|nr:1-acyl-sn-glycerol-3-phosphate acyltransferase [Bacillota bacterium]